MKNLSFFLLFLLSACSQQSAQQNQAIISEELMVQMIADLATADAMIELEVLNANKLIYQKKMSFYKSIFEKYNYSQEDFEQSFKVYSEDLIAFDLMYDKVLEELSKREIILNE